ncbi:MULTISPECIES: hypothetical protein [Fischerella]|nr:MULTISPECIES: hypothetical protein [Fischerella]
MIFIIPLISSLIASSDIVDRVSINAIACLGKRGSLDHMLKPQQR